MQVLHRRGRGDDSDDNGDEAVLWTRDVVTPHPVLAGTKPSAPGPMQQKTVEYAASKKDLIV